MQRFEKFACHCFEQKKIASSTFTKKYLKSYKEKKTRLPFEWTPTNNPKRKTDQILIFLKYIMFEYKKEWNLKYWKRVWTFTPRSEKFLVKFLSSNFFLFNFSWSQFTWLFLATLFSCCLFLYLVFPKIFCN